MFRTIVALALVLVVTTEAMAATPLSVRIGKGETLVLRIVGQKAEILDRQAAGEPSAFEVFALRQAQGVVMPPGMDKAPAIPFVGDAPAPFIMIPNQVRLTFRDVSGANVLDTHTLLTIENGYTQSFRYRAQMRWDSKTLSTDVCEVFAGVPGFEHWPHNIEWLDLSELRLEEQLGSQPRCE